MESIVQVIFLARTTRTRTTTTTIYDAIKQREYGKHCSGNLSCKNNDNNNNNNNNNNRKNSSNNMKKNTTRFSNIGIQLIREVLTPITHVIFVTLLLSLLKI